MKQEICKRFEKMLSCIVVMSIVLAMGMLASCSESDNPTQGGAASEVADLVVYGKIFTSENNQIVEAFAVKDGKYIYVGDKKGAEAYIEAGKTRLVDYRGKGLVMPGCGNGHSHYMLGYAPLLSRKQRLRGQHPSSAKAGDSRASIQCQPERTWMQSAATSPCTSWTRNVIRHWVTPSC